MLQAARKVYDTALSSMQASSSQHHAASLALAYGESELSRGGNEAPMRALHVLAWLGSGGPFMPFKPLGKGISPNIHEMFTFLDFGGFGMSAPTSRYIQFTRQR